MAVACLGCGRLIRRGTRCADCAVRSDAAPGWPALRQQVLERDLHRCQLRLPGCTGVATAVDHVNPASKRERTTNPDDLLAACQPCNSRKRDSLQVRGGGLERASRGD